MMKFKFRDYEVEVKARPVGGRANKEYTEEVLNYISLCFSEAADKLENDGLLAMAEEARESGDNIYKTLKLSGTYDGLE